jgi:hypothetical protein
MSSFRVFGILTAAVTCAGVLVATPMTPAVARPGSSHVHVQGQADCSRGYNIPATRVRIQTASGEAKDADVNFLGRYSADFNKVPSRGQTATAYIYCAGGRKPGGAPTWGWQFRLTRPGWLTDNFTLDLHRSMQNR